jgi:carbonic anhydrase
MSHPKSKEFFAAVTCMDGRIQKATEKYINRHYGDHHVDLVTGIGPNKTLAERRTSFRHGKKNLLDSAWSKFVIRNIKEMLRVSVEAHHTKMFFIVGHDCCAGNPAHKEAQITHLRQAKKTVESFGLNKKIVLLWVEQDWKTVEEIK